LEGWSSSPPNLSLGFPGNIFNDGRSSVSREVIYEMILAPLNAHLTDLGLFPVLNRVG